MISSEILIEVAFSAAIFIALWIVLGGVFFKPYFALLEEREERTVGDEKRTVKKRAELKSLNQELEEKLHQARVRGISAREAIVQKAKEESQVVLDAAGEVVSSELETARAEIQKLKDQAHAELETEAEKLAAGVIERILPEKNPPLIH